MKLRVSSSVVGFEKRATETWKLPLWDGVNDPDKEVVFFGLYHERDFAVFEGDFTRRIVFWCGSDILRVMSDYERRRILKNYPETEHYCENEVEQINLHGVGIEAKIVPSFLDDFNKFPLSFKAPTDRKWKIWACAHPNREDEYGLALAKRWAEKDPELEFHFYGIDKPEGSKDLPNVIYHGHVPEEQLNKEIQEYHCGFRPNFHDGASEVVIKSILLGQYPIARIKYEKVMNYTTEQELKECWNKLKEQTLPNLETREYWENILNKFPFLK
jgi:hypothetical protein